MCVFEFLNFWHIKTYTSKHMNTCWHNTFRVEHVTCSYVTHTMITFISTVIKRYWVENYYCDWSAIYILAPKNYLFHELCLNEDQNHIPLDFSNQTDEINLKSVCWGFSQLHLCNNWSPKNSKSIFLSIVNEIEYGKSMSSQFKRH
jgi:hypothetical protein